MFSGLKRLVGHIDVTEKNGLIYVEGLPADFVAKDITRIWSTSKIVNFMFTSIARSSVSFNSFFAPDITYTLQTILNQRSRSYNNRAIAKVVELLYENTWLKTTREEHPSILDPSRVDQEMFAQPLPHQKEFLDVYNTMVPRMKLWGYLLAAVPGSGKTLGSLMVGVALDADVFVEIVPKNAVDEVWDKTLRTAFKKPQNHKYWTSLSGKPLEWGYRHYVFHYEQLPRAIEFFKQNKSKYVKPFMIVDESHNLNELDSLRTNLWIDLCRTMECVHVVPMSGTPLKAIGNEAIPIMSVLCSDFNEDSRQRFKEIFGKNASRATDILRNRLGLMMYKVDKVVDNGTKELRLNVKIPNGDAYTLDAVRDVMKKFIAERMAFYKENFKKFEAIYFEAMRVFQHTLEHGEATNAFKRYQGFINEIRRGYDPKTMKDMVIFCNKYEKGIIAPRLPRELRIAFLDARSVVKYYDLKVQGEALGQVFGRLRAQCNVDMVPYVGMPSLIDGSLSKTIIFTSYVNVVKACETYLKQEGYQPLLVYGDTNKNLKTIVQQFAANEDLNPLVATFDSLSTAVPMVMASTSIFLNSPFRDYEYKQAKARTDRLDQKFPVTIWNVFLDTDGKPNLSTRSNDILNWSRDMVDELMGRKGADLDLALEVFQEEVKDEEGNQVDVDGFIAQPNWMQWTNS